MRTPPSSTSASTEVSPDGRNTAMIAAPEPALTASHITPTTAPTARGTRRGFARARRTAARETRRHSMSVRRSEDVIDSLQHVGQTGGFHECVAQIGGAKRSPQFGGSAGSFEPALGPHEYQVSGSLGEVNILGRDQRGP